MRCRNERRVNAYIATSHDCAETRPWAKAAASRRHYDSIVHGTWSRCGHETGSGVRLIYSLCGPQTKIDHSSVAAMLAFMSRSRKRHQLM